MDMKLRNGKLTLTQEQTESMCAFFLYAGKRAKFSATYVEDCLFALINEKATLLKMVEAVKI